MNTCANEVALIEGIAAVPTILNVVCQVTRMGFAAVARVTEDRWVACSVLDKIDFGLKPGGELKLETTICHEVRQSRQAVTIDHVAEDVCFRHHQTPALYGFQSYISMPIVLPDGRFFGTLCAIDPRPARVSTPEVVGMFKLFAELIAFHFDAAEKVARSESRLLAEREISELREQFIGVLGHDLRNPLGAISMGATLLAEATLDEGQARALEMMQSSVVRMSGLIEDTLDFTRGRLGGGIALEAISDEPVEPVLRQVVREVRARWPERALEAHFDLREGIHHDRRRLAQLFTNLLANAMTHGKAGGVVKVRAISGGGAFELSVANAAAPIPPHILQRLFEPFARGSGDDLRQGLGLGLYIASEIARSHHGHLGVQANSEEICFTFTMASNGLRTDAAPPEQPASPGKPAPSTSRRILLIEDHTETLNMLARLLARRGHVVATAPSGAAARAEFARGDFDLIVSDIGLPDCSGLELIAELRAVRPMPAIVLSGFEAEAGSQANPNAGILEYLVKPVDFEQLLRTVERLTQRAP